MEEHLPEAILIPVSATDGQTPFVQRTSLGHISLDEHNLAEGRQGAGQPVLIAELLVERQALLQQLAG
jgi:hypothetical protein